MMRWPLRGRHNRPGRPPEANDAAPAGAPSPSFVAGMVAGARSGDPVAMANLGAYLSQQGRPAEAIEWTERAWQRGNLAAGFNVGTLYVQAGEPHRADLVWTRAAELDGAPHSSIRRP